MLAVLLLGKAAALDDIIQGHQLRAIVKLDEAILVFVHRDDSSRPKDRMNDLAKTAQRFSVLFLSILAK